MIENFKPIRLTGHHDGFGLTERCIVLAADPPHPVNGTHHHYALARVLYDGEVLLYPEADHLLDFEVGGQEVPAVACGEVIFQRGPRYEKGSTPGILDVALLQVLLHRYRCFQAGPYGCRENALVITKLEEAQHWMEHRARERSRRGVLGKNAK